MGVHACACVRVFVWKQCTSEHVRECVCIYVLVCWKDYLQTLRITYPLYYT